MNGTELFFTALLVGMSAVGGIFGLYVIYRLKG
jgi:hypothetical protein